MELQLTAMYSKGKSQISFLEDTDNHDYMYIYDNLNDSYEAVPEWQYNIDQYDFDYLEQGYNIIYMPDATHAAFWNYIASYYDDIEHQEGLNRYFDYCKIHHIYHDYLITSCECELPDIFDLEKEECIYEPEVR